jgi:SAM-dependent methyltransferase
MLEEAERRTRGLKVELLRQDLRQLALPEKVDLLTCNADSLNYLLEEGELLLSLARFRENLRPGGYAVFDVNTPYQLMGQEDGATWEMRLGDMRMYWRSRYDLGSGIATLEMRHVEEGPDGELCYREVHREGRRGIGAAGSRVQQRLVLGCGWTGPGLRRNPPPAVPGARLSGGGEAGASDPGSRGGFAEGPVMREATGIVPAGTQKL